MTIYLSDVRLDLFIEQDRTRISPYGEKLIAEAYAALCAKGLRYNSSSGITRNNYGELSRYSNEQDIPADYTISEIAEYALQPFVRNLASRFHRGFSA